MAKPIDDLMKAFAKVYDEYLSDLNALAEKPDNQKSDIDLLKSYKPLIVSYYYIKKMCDQEISADDNLPKIIECVLESLFPLCVEFYKPESTNTGSELRQALRQICADMTADICLQLNIIAFCSYKFCTRFVENQGLGILYKYLTNNVLLDAYVDAFRSGGSGEAKSKRFLSIDSTMRRTIGALVCMARTYTSFKTDWKTQNSVENFLRYLERTHAIIDNKIYTCMGIAFVADDDDVDKLPQLKEIIPDLTYMSGLAAAAIKKNENLKRELFFLDDAGKVSREVYCVNHLDTLWSLINILKALYQMSVSDKLKDDIYFKHDLGKHLRDIILHGNDCEKEYSIMLLWQLCFSKTVAADVLADAELYSYVENLSKQPDTEESRGLKKNASGVIWLLNKTTESSGSKAKTPGEIPVSTTTTATPMTKREPSVPNESVSFPGLDVEEVNRKHIMISYNRDSRDLCLKIKAELEKDKHLVWIDVEDICGSSLESMAKAIENSVCVLMCMTEKYKQSPNCRAEAEYSFQLGRPIIPLIMQKDYKPDGWLGIILGSKIFVHFMKYDFDECMRRVRAELTAVFKENQIKAGILEMFKPKDEKPVLNTEQQKIFADTLKTPVETQQAIARPAQTSQQPAAPPEHIQAVVRAPSKPTVSYLDVKEINWTETQVQKWFIEKKIDQAIIRNISPCDGRVLYELFMIKNETPEFFYKSIGFVNNTFKSSNNLRDIAHFSYELKKLFLN